jgi:hypothetical protein
VIKTLQQWHEANTDLGKFLSVGDRVDVSIFDYFLGVLPPRTLTCDLLQIGEPFDHLRGRATYPTLRREPLGWVYAGNCFAGVRFEPEPEPPTYRIVRGFRDREARVVIKTGLALAEAQAWCRDPETSSSTARSNEATRRTAMYGPWFDGYEAEA